MQQPFNKRNLTLLIAVLLVVGKSVLATTTDLTDDEVLSFTETDWNTNCSFEEVARLMKGPDQDLVRFTVSARSVSGVTPACADLSSARVNFKYNGNNYTVTAGTPVDVILSNPNVLENAVTITEAQATFTCSNGTIANPPASCDVISPGGFGLPSLVNGGTKSLFDFLTPGGCGTSGSGLVSGRAIFDQCDAVEVELTVTYEKRRLKLNLTDADFICQDIPSDEQGASFKPTVGVQAVGDVTVPFMGNGYAFEVSDAVNGTYRLVKETRTEMTSFTYDDLVLASETPGVRYIRVRDLSCTGRESTPRPVTVYPSVDVSFTRDLGSKLSESVRFNITRSAYYDTVDMVYTIRKLALNSRTVTDGLVADQYVFAGNSGACVSSGTCDPDQIDDTDTNLAGTTGDFPPNFTYYIIADPQNPDATMDGACPRGQFFDIDVNPTVSISTVATLAGSSFHVCKGGTTTINGSFAKQGLDVGGMTVNGFNLQQFKDNEAGGLELSISDGSGSLTKVNGSSLSLAGLDITAFRLENAGAATYTFTPSDLDGKAFKNSRSVTISEAPEITVTQDGTTNHVSCPGNSDGSFTFTVSGGTANGYVVRYKSGADGIISASGGKYTLSGRAAGTYNITVTDGGGCSLATPASFTILQPASYNPGSDETIYVCEPTVDITASALPSSNAAGSWDGTWTRTSGMGNIDNNQSESTSITDLELGENVFKWTAEVGTCPTKFEKTITVQYLQSTEKDAGSDIYTRVNSATLSADAPDSNEKGEWTSIAGTANINSASSNTSSVTSLSTGTNTFRWDISLNETLQNPTCNEVKSDVVNVFYSNLAGTFVSKADETCGDDGSITVTASGGIGGGFDINGDNFKYAYTISPKPPAYPSATLYGDAAVTFDNLPAGTYTFTVSNAESSNFAQVAIPIKFSPTSNDFVISENPNRLSIGNPTNIKEVVCSDGSVQISYSNGIAVPTATLLKKNASDMTFSAASATVNISAGIVTFSNISETGMYKIRLDDGQCISETENEFEITGVSTAIGTVTSNAVSRNTIGDTEYFYYCEDDNAFNVSISVSGVDSPFKYELWKNGTVETQQNNATSTGNAATIPFNSLDLDADYQLRVFGRPGCPPNSFTDYKFRLVKPRPTVSVTSFRQSCFGVADAGYSLTVSGGLRPYQVNINSAGNQSIGATDVYTSPAFSSGTFSYEITDANGCVWTGYPAFTVAAKNEIFIQNATGGSPLTSYEIDCPGGGIDLVYRAAGGTGTYQDAKLINNRTSAERSATSIGGLFTFANVLEDNTTYDLIITDSDGCQKTLENIVVNDPDDLTVSNVTTAPPTCFSGDDGSFTVSASGGTPDPAGYKFQITNARMVNSLSSANDSDFGKTLTGEFGINDEDPQTFTSTGEFTRPAGIYTVVVFDEKGCTVADPIEVTVPNAIQFTVNEPTVTPASCSEIEDGSLQITTTGGNSGTYTFELFEVAAGSSLPVFRERKTSTNGEIRFSTLSGDDSKFTYLVNVTDGQGCPASRTNMSPGIIANPVEVVQIGMSSPPLCNIVDGDDASGSFVVEGRAGRGSYSFSLTGVDGTFQSSTDNRFEFKKRTPGSYTVYVKDASNCVNVIADDIIVPTTDPIAIETIVNLDGSRDQTMSATLSYALCDGETTSITVGESNGKYPMTYQLTGTTEAGVIFSSSILSATAANEQETFTNIPAGNYQVTATHAGQCVAVSNDIRLFTTDRPVVTVEKSIKVSQAGTDYHISCNGGADGIITITVDGRTDFGDFTIELFADGISTGNGIAVAGGTALEFSGLSASTATGQIVYTYTIKNSLTPQCIWEYNDPITLNEPDQLNITSNAITTLLVNDFEIACFGDAIEYQVDFEGGIYPFRIFLKNTLDQTVDATIINEDDTKSHTFPNVFEGDYYIEIEDFFGNTCQVRTPDFNIDAPPLLEPSVVTNLPPTCLAGSDGTIQLSATGGNPIAGTSYRFEITDYSLTPPFNINGENCENFSTNMIEDASAVFRLPAGIYDFKITDDNGCVKTLQNIEIELPADPLIIDAVIAEEPSCNGAGDGRLKVLAKDGSPLSGGRYEYRLSGGNLLADEVITTADTAVFEGLFSSEDVGTYSISIFDTDACCLVAGYNYETNIEITQPSAMELNLVGSQTSQPTCFEGTDGSKLTVEVTGGVGPYTFSTDGINFSTSPLGSQFQLTEIPGGENYMIYVRDSRFNSTQTVCTISESFFLPDGATLSIETTSSEVSCFGGSNGSASATVTLMGSEDGLDASSVDNPSAFTYEWLWLEENRIVATTKEAENLSAGTYRLKVQRVGLVCEQSAIVIIKQPQRPLEINDLETFKLSCGGRSDGSVIVSMTGGNPLANQRLQYSLNGGEMKELPITNTIRDLAEGAYTITIENALGCSASGEFEILSNLLQVSTTIEQQVSCFGFDNGRLRVEASMTQQAFTLPTSLEYSLDGINFQSSPVFDGLSAGAYRVTVRDAANNFCNGLSEEVELEEPDEITINASLVSSSNCGQADGVVEVGTNAINPTITWLDMSNSVADPTGLRAGTYRILVVDQSGCSAEATYTLEDAPEMILTPVVDAGTFCDLPRGRAHLEISNGVAPYEVTWNNGSQVLTGQSVAGLTGGLYQISVVDANGCARMTSLAIENQIPFTVALTESVTTACGEDLGSLTVTAFDGFAPYSYYWPALDVTGQSVDGLSQGSYQVIVTDNLGCTVSETFTILPETGNISIETSLTLPVCNSNSGSITIDDVIGGIAPYQFTWRDSNQQLLQEGGQELINLTVGTYFVEVLDSDGCRYAQPAIELISDVTREPSLSVEAIVESYCEAANGSVTIEIVQGQAPYQLTILDNNDQVIDVQTTNFSTVTFGLLKKGTYHTLLEDANGCESTLDFTITDRPLPQISVTDIGSATREIAVGSFTVNISDPVGEAFTFLVDDRDGNVRSFENQDISGLLSGDYLVSATNGTCTTNTVLVTIGENEPVEIESSFKAATCPASNDGEISLSIQGGVLPYTTQWLDGEGNVITGSINTAQNLPVGQYSVVVQDAIGTTVEYPFDIIALPQLSIQVIEQQNPKCFEACDGIIEVEITGGSGNYALLWDNGMEGNRITGLCKGTYQLVVTDEQNNVCTTTKSITLEEPNQITAELSESRLPACFNGNDGSLTVEISGGSGLFELVWENGEQGNTINGISAGAYSVTVNDLIGGCQHIFEFELADQLPIELSETIVSPPSCYGASDGQAEIRLVNTTNPLISWSNGDIGFFADGLAAGDHIFTVLDGNGCRFAGRVTIPETLELVISEITGSAVSCFEEADGTISLSVTGGTGSKSVIWFLDGNELTALTDEFNPSLLKTGDYRYLVTDENGCSISGLIEISSPDPLTFRNTAITPVSCNGGDDGQLALEATGGNEGYIFTMDGEAVTFPVSGLSADEYLISVSDANGCRISQTVSVGEPALLLVDNVSITDVSCDGAADGAITVSVFGGTGDYIFEWSNAEQSISERSATIDRLTTGTYEVTITDSKGCRVTESYQVGTPNPISLVNLRVSDPQCFQGSDGQISFDVIGGTAPYSYSWEHNQGNSNTATDLSSGSYSVTVTDANGCFREFEFNLEEPLQLFITTLDQTQISLCNGSGLPQDAGVWASYQWYLNDELISTNRIVEANSRGIYRVVVQSEKGCIAEKSVEVQIEENPLTADFVFDTDIFAQDTLVVIDVSWPVPGTINWFFPEGVTRLTGSDDAIIQQLIFDQPGIYTIGMMATDQGCSDYIEKRFEVIEKNDRNELIVDRSSQIRETAIEETVISPVPNKGQFELIIKLDQKADVEVSIYGLSQTNLLQRLEGKSRYTYQFDIDLGDVTPGIYLVVTRSGKSTKVNKIIVR